MTSNEARATTLVRALRAGIEGDQEELRAVFTDDVRAWTPVLSLGCTIAAGYILNALAPIPALESPAVSQWLAANGGRTAADGVAAALLIVR